MRRYNHELKSQKYKNEHTSSNKPEKQKSQTDSQDWNNNDCTPFLGSWGPNLNPKVSQKVSL